MSCTCWILTPGIFGFFYDFRINLRVKSYPAASTIIAIFKLGKPFIHKHLNLDLDITSKTFSFFAHLSPKNDAGPKRP